jgi:hypothetical protein
MDPGSLVVGELWQRFSDRTSRVSKLSQGLLARCDIAGVVFKEPIQWLQRQLQCMRLVVVALVDQIVQARVPIGQNRRPSRVDTMSPDG